jgi:hypothetical protein
MMRGGLEAEVSHDHVDLGQSCDASSGGEDKPRFVHRAEANRASIAIWSSKEFHLIVMGRLRSLNGSGVGQ